MAKREQNQKDDFSEGLNEKLSALSAKLQKRNLDMRLKRTDKERVFCFSNSR
ncbi:hypothetical protein [Marinicella meishanensis]|uniref:hypothetical protein n=1 Tax=Marinicella meishanensis TaxID=2873263 RepID=UPI001CBEBC95|nr:hypothetical protein [Marinicella sp. NBU2979]